MLHRCRADGSTASDLTGPRPQTSRFRVERVTAQLTGVLVLLNIFQVSILSQVEILLSRIADLREEQEKLNLFRHNLARGLNDTVAIMKAQIEHIENLQQISKR